MNERLYRHPKRLLTHALPAACLALAAAGCQPVEAPAKPVPRPAEARVGINIEGLAYWGSEVPFVNLMKLASSPWLTQCDPRHDTYCAEGLFTVPGGSAWNTREQGKLDLDAQGYPRSLPDPARAAATQTNFTTVSALVPTGLSPQRRSGRFIVLYEGDGTLSYGRGAVRNTGSSSPGRDVLDVTTDGIQSWFQLSIVATDPGKTGRYLRNLRVIPDGGVCSSDPAVACTPATETATCPDAGRCEPFERPSALPLFHPDFLKNLRPFQTIRFMAYQNTNASLVDAWEQRTLPDRVSWVSEHGDGGPIEAIAALGNQLGTDIWVNLPTRAADDYVRQFATFMRDHLDRRRRIYVEYSNEAWNGMFPAAAWIQAQALRRWPTAKDTPFGKQLQWYGLRSAEICEIWRAVFGPDAARIHCVIGAQAANPWTAKQALDCPLGAAESADTACVRRGITGLAIAPYFGYYLGHPRHLAALHAWVQQPGGGLDSLFAELYTGGAFDDSPAGGGLADAREQMMQAADIAQTHGIELLAYEGGQHLVGLQAVVADQAVTALFIAANRDPRIGTAYRAHLTDWLRAGGGLYNLWNSVGPYTQWGSWGLLEYRDQADTPKYRAATQPITDPGRRDPP